MTDYNDGKWHGWNGGECPVHPKSVVEVALHRGVSLHAINASRWDWSDDDCPIIAFRVVKEYREPREVYLNEWSQYNVLSGKSYAKSTWGECSPDDKGAVLFREVIE